MKINLAVRVILPFLLIPYFATGEDVLVQTESGPVRGTTLVSPRNNKTFYAFMGIPYAKPPLGALRFKAPDRVESWTEVRNATKEGSVCPQIKTWTKGEFVGEDDCLFLNIYTLRIKGDHPKPVMVWIHGGGFKIESGNMEYAGPHYLVEEDIVYVSINYRLGPLGFLYLGNEEVPGNAGLKDQVLALKWVQENIEHFGGDPNKVTIVGESAGSMSVELHKLSPMSKGLFHHAIAESGTALGLWQLENPNDTIAFEYGEILGISTTNKSELVEKLRTFTAKQLIDAASKWDEKNPEAVVQHFIPVIDSNSTPGDVFLPDDPLNIFNAGKFNKVPSIIGINSAEGILTLSGVKNYTNRIEEYIGLVVKGSFRDEVSNSTFNEIIGKIKDFYFHDTTVNKSILQGFIDLTTDIIFSIGAFCTANKLNTYSTYPVYFYEFSFSGEMNLYKKLFGGSDFPGAAHVDEMMYIFSRLPDKFKKGSPELLTSERMVKMWANFIKTGIPTPEKDPLLQNIMWPPYRSTSQEYLSIDNDITVQEHIKKNNIDFWMALYGNYTKRTLCWDDNDNNRGGMRTARDSLLLVVFTLLLPLLFKIH